MTQPDISQPVRDRINEMEAWRKSFSPQQGLDLEQKMKAMQLSMKMVEGAYEVIAKVMNQGPAFNARLGYYVDQQCDEILKRNKELDKAFTELVKTIKATNPPQSFLNEMYSEGYKEILEVFTKQTNSFNEIFKARGSLSSKAKKTQKYISQLTEKYMAEMSKHMR